MLEAASNGKFKFLFSIRLTKSGLVQCSCGRMPCGFLVRSSAKFGIQLIAQ